MGEFVYAVTAAEGVILSLFTSNDNEDKMIPSAMTANLPKDMLMRIDKSRDNQAANQNCHQAYVIITR